MRKCYLYLRISTEKQASGDGLDRQEAMLLDYVKDNAVKLGLDPDNYEFIVDRGKSAFKGQHMENTSGLGKFFTRLVEGKIKPHSVLIVESLDRFSRQNPFLCMKYLSVLDEHKVELHDVDKKLIISRKVPNSLTFATMIAQRAYDESCLKSDRVKKGWNRRRTRAKDDGDYMIKNTPAWISVSDEKYVLNDNHKIVREIFDLYLTGIGSFTIAQMLNRQGKFISEFKWDTAKICRILRNVRCRGDYISNIIERDLDNDEVSISEITIPNLYPAIVSVHEFSEVQRRLDKHNFMGRIRGDSKKTVFNSLLKCSLCGAALALSTSGKYRYLKCFSAREKLGCIGTMMSYDAVEKAILTHIKNVDFEKIAKKQDITELDTIKGQVADLERYVKSFTDGFARLRDSGRTPTFEMMDQKAVAEEQLQQLRQVLLEKEGAVSISNINISSDIFDVKNIKERGALEIELCKVIEKIRIMNADGNLLAITISYFSNVLLHMLIINKKTGELLNQSSLEDIEGVTWLKSSFCDINLDTKEPVYYREPTEIDTLVMGLWGELMMKVASEMKSVQTNTD
ncbi:recombinase family protein [Serratia fonticola]|uniref:Recombinase family protein n=2 Tax=Serratia fonticola TaxID=47917 RepID=A0ABY9PLA7_SERFO|nr:recombinase family protein [Serratia fonticola]WMT13513.1 recombinase family protein [Serratia fonticola]